MRTRSFYFLHLPPSLVMGYACAYKEWKKVSPLSFRATARCTPLVPVVAPRFSHLNFRLPSLVSRLPAFCGFPPLSSRLF